MISCLGLYLTVFRPGSIHENRKLLTSGNCDATRPRMGIPTIDAVFHRKSMSNRPGFSLIVRLRIGSRLIDAYVEMTIAARIARSPDNPIVRAWRLMNG